MVANAIEKLLVNDWASGLRLTTVPQAMHRLGYADEIETRWHIANRLYDRWQSILASPEKMQSAASAIELEDASGLDPQHWLGQVVTWGRASILLTNNEKLVARNIWNHHLRGQQLPPPENAVAVLDITAEEVDNAIQMLVRLGFLSLPQGRPANRYILAEDADRFLEGLGFSFHTVTLNGQEQFGVP